MKGLVLARRYYEDVVRPAFKAAAAEELPQLAFGLAGPGSECFSFDDELSRDHDWGPRVCVWVPEDLILTAGTRLQAVYDELPGTFLTYGPIHRLDTRVRRDGIMPARAFFQTYLGTSELPHTLRDWLLLPEDGLAVCTNGEVFEDGPGEFSAHREALLAYYPADIRLKKIASRLRAAGAHGEYNLDRALRRGDQPATLLHVTGFMTECARLACALQRTYLPPAKWLFRALLDMGQFGTDLHRALSATEAAATGSSADRRGRLAETIERCSAVVRGELRSQGLAGNAPYLYDLGLHVESLIQDDALREGLDTIE